MEVGDIDGDGGAEAALVACECCGFTEECTARYIAGVRTRYGGRWICGLCGDAVSEELGRAAEPPISPGEALDRHVAVCSARRASARPSPAGNAGDLIAAVRVLLLRRLASPPPSTPPRRVRSTPSSPRPAGASAATAADAETSTGSGIALVRTGICFAVLVEGEDVTARFSDPLN